MTKLPKISSHEGKLFSIKEAADFLDVSEKTLRRWEANGKLFPIRTEGGHRRYSLTEIQKAKRRPKEIKIPKHEPVKIITDYKLSEVPKLYKTLEISQRRVVAYSLLSLASLLLVTFIIKTNTYISKEILKPVGPEPKVLQAATSALATELNVFLPTNFRDVVTFENGITSSDLTTLESLNVEGLLTSNDLAIDGGNITSRATTINLFNTLTTTINMGGQATTINLGATTGNTTINNNLIVSGNIDINGTGTHDIAGTLNLSGNQLTSSGDLNLNLGGGDLIFADGDVINIGGSGSDVDFNVIGDSTSGASSAMNSDDDLYIEGNIEVDGTITGTFTGTINPGLTEGAVLFQGATGISADSTNFFWNDTDNILRIGSGGKINPSVDLGSDLGTASLRWNNIYVNAVNSNATSSFTGQAIFTYDPTNTTFTQSSVLINPTAPSANEWMLGIGQGGNQRAGVDAEGDLVLGYSSGVSAPSASNPFEVYNHGSTKIFSLATTGDVTLEDAVDALNFDTNTLSIDALNERVGIGTAAPNGPLDVGSLYSYQQEVTITNGGGTLTDYAILHVLDTATPVAAGKMQSDCGDIRYTNSANTARYQYYIEGGCNTSATQIWVKIPSIPNGNTVINLHYGNASAGNATMTWSGNYIAPFESTCPSGWSSVSALNDSNRFPQGSTTYGTTGGSATHTHTFSGTFGGPSNTGTDSGGSASTVATNAHTHTFSFVSSTGSNLPNYIDVVYCSPTAGGFPANVTSTNYLGFATTTPASWTRDASFDTFFPRGNTTAGGTASGTHDHTFSGTTSNESATTTVGNLTASLPGNHTHSVTTKTSNTTTQLPPFLDLIFANPNSASNTLPQGLIGIADTATMPPMGWTRYSSLDSRYPRGNSSSGGTGGADTHAHPYNAFNTAAQNGNRGGNFTINVAQSHTHTEGAGNSTSNSATPPFATVVYIQKNTDSTTNATGTETQTSYNEGAFIVTTNNQVGIGTTTPSSDFHLLDNNNTATASATIENVTSLADYSPIGMILKIGTDSTNPGNDDRYINFMKGDGTIVGKIQGNGSGGVAYTTTGVDFAEYFKKSDTLETIETGDVVCLDGNTEGVTKCTPANQNILGVISSTPGFVGGSDKENDPNYVLVGLVGQVEAKIASESAAIVPGDFLTISTITGKVKKATSGSYAVGRALEEWNNMRPMQTISIFVQPVPYIGSISENGFVGEAKDIKVETSNTSLATLLGRILGAATEEPDTGEEKEPPEATSSGTISVSVAEALERLTETTESIKTDIDLLKNQILIASTEPLPNEASENLSSLDGELTTLGDTVISGKLNIGTIQLEGSGNAIDAIGDLNLQPLALGKVKLIAGKIEIDTRGNLILYEGQIFGNDTFRGSVTINPGETEIEVSKGWEDVPEIITANASYDTYVWVENISENGFKLKVKDPPEETMNIYWIAVW